MENRLHTSQAAQELRAAQLASYTDVHHDRRNLVLHALTVPIFMAGTVAVLASPAVSWWLLPAGFGALLAAMAAQGKGHSLEERAPAPFRGPSDVIVRIFVEQWITFPRFVLSGAFARAWRRG
jgi:hypothetical protein